MLRRLLLLALLALSSPALGAEGVVEINQTCAVQTGCVEGDDPGYPVVLTASGSYRLTGDLQNVNTLVNAIEIDASNVVLDLGGFTVGSCSTACPVGGTGSGIEAILQENVEVRDGSVVGFPGSGILLGTRGVARSLRSLDNAGTGIAGQQGSLITGCHAVDNGGFGITVGGLGTRVTNNVVSGNGAGIGTADGGSVTDNVVTQNVGAGILGVGSALVRGNVVRANGGDGINVRSGLISGNDVRNNGGPGVIVRAPSRIEGNSVFENGGDGIDAQLGGRSDIVGNSVGENVGIGLNLVDTSAPDAVYRDNVMYDNDSGTVAGGADRGGNSCRNNTGLIGSCP